MKKQMITPNAKQKVTTLLKRAAKSVFQVGIPVTSSTRPLFSSLYFLHIMIREVGIWLLRFLYYEPLFKSQCRYIGKGLWMEKLPYIVNSGVIDVDKNVRLSGKPTFAFSTRLHPAPSVSIGDNTFIGHDAGFSAGKSIVVGSNCFIAGGVQIMDNDGHPLNYADRAKHLPPRMEDVKEVRIGDNVWIGGGALILKGVTIGDRAVVGARAVVTRDVPSDTVVAGNPARVIKHLQA
jgi:acetyltransferase-like isoleucine patch superfamily enzyme